MSNFFELFNMAESCNVDQQKLRQKYFELQKKYHPDSNKNPDIDISTINKGFHTLSNVMLTMLYILEMHNIKISAGQTDPIFLAECMELVEDLDSNNRDDVLLTISNKIHAFIEQAQKMIDKKMYNESVEFVQKTLYLQKIASKNKE